MNYKTFKEIMSTGIAMAKEGSAREVIGGYFMTKGIHVSDYMLDEFVENAEIQYEDPNWPPDFSILKYTKPAKQTEIALGV